MHEIVNRNMNIALISRNDVRPRLDFRGNSVANGLNKDEYHLKRDPDIRRDGNIVLDLGSNIGLTAFLFRSLPT
jgi:hypothetical protein